MLGGCCTLLVPVLAILVGMGLVKVDFTPLCCAAGKLVPNFELKSGDKTLQAILRSMAASGLLCAKEAKAVGVAFDYRKLEEIDPSTRKLVGDLNSEKSQKAIAVIASARQKAEELLRKYKDDVTVRWKPFLTPIPEMRTALEEIQELRWSSATAG
eukprot:Skav211970  [mRNA]  locus=scaffold4541:27061:34247:- [translate_table: standard]